MSNWDHAQLGACYREQEIFEMVVALRMAPGQTHELIILAEKQNFASNDKSLLAWSKDFLSPVTGAELIQESALLPCELLAFLFIPR